MSICQFEILEQYKIFGRWGAMQNTKARKQTQPAPLTLRGIVYCQNGKPLQELIGECFHAFYVVMPMTSACGVDIDTLGKEDKSVC